MKHPYWYEILKHFEQCNYVYNGLTLPFLIGAEVFFEKDAELMSIADFIEEVNSTSVNLRVFFCENIKEYVFGLLDSETEGYGNYYHTIDNFMVIDDSLNDIKTSKELIYKLSAEYNELIQHGEYSKNEGEWGYFNDTDKARLNEIVSTLM